LGRIARSIEASLMYDFPFDPAPGQEYTPPVGGQTYVWQPPRWLVKGIPPASGGGGGGIPEAPIDSQQYAREDANWTVVEPGVSDWADITGKPATFPPTLPIAQSGVTNLTTDLTARVLKAGDTMTGPLVLPQGTLAAPALKFTGTQVNGIWADNFTLKFTTTGQLGIALDTNQADFFFPVRVPLGAPAGPSLRFSGTSAAGFYGIASPNGVGVNGALTLAADPTAPLMAATKQYVDTMDANKAPLASPVFTGNPTAPTPATGDNDTSLATTEFVKAQGYLTAVPATYAPLASPTFTGDPKAPTPAAGDNDTSLATTAFVTDALATAKTTANTDYVNATGDTMTGSLVVSQFSPVLTINKTNTASAAIINGKNSLTNRWTIQLGDGTAEGGSNAGSNFVINRHSDAGSIVGNPLSITRSTGLITVEGDPTAPLGIATKQYVDAKAGVAIASVSDAAPSSPVNGQLWFDSSLGTLYIYYNDGTSSQWVQVVGSG
jgi:hypothetical protein